MQKTNIPRFGHIFKFAKDETLPRTALETFLLHYMPFDTEDHFTELLSAAIEEIKAGSVPSKSLADITDEELVQVAQIAGMWDAPPATGKQLITEYMHSSRCNVKPINWLEIFDYLRDRGYKVE